MDRKLLKFSLVCVTGVLVLSANPKPAKAFDEPVAGYTYDKVLTINNSSGSNINLSTLSSDNTPVPGFSNIGIANVDTNLLIRKGPGENEKVLGKLPRHAGCSILDTSGEWTKISSGKVTGYVKSEYLITGSAASQMALKVGNLLAKANEDGLRVRKSASVDSDILDTVAKGEDLLVLDSLVVNYGEDHNKWVKVSLDGDDSENGTVGYVAKEYVDIAYELKKAVSLEELEFGSGVSSLRANLVNTAKKYLGNPYVWGGTNLTNGVDCSGFTRGIYSKFGYYLPRVSRDQAVSGTKISSSQLKPGDLVFYGNNSSGYIDHVAMYIGDGRIIHASNPRDGIKISNLYYRQPIKCARFINE